MKVPTSIKERYLYDQLYQILTKDGTVSTPAERILVLQRQEQYGNPSRSQENERLINTVSMVCSFTILLNKWAFEPYLTFKVLEFLLVSLERNEKKACTWHFPINKINAAFKITQLLSLSPSLKAINSLLTSILLDEENEDSKNYLGENEKRIHWDRLLLMLTEWERIKSFEAMSLVKDLIKSLMSKGLHSESESDLLAAFILARHCSLVAPKIFSRYEKWYTNMFESEMYSPAKEPSTFRFLTKVLTKWVPVEPPCFLQVQATFWPFIPPSCRTLWSDYVSLAKIRITEYNEVESAMEWEPNPNNPVCIACEHS